MSAKGCATMCLSILLVSLVQNSAAMTTALQLRGARSMAETQGLHDAEEPDQLEIEVLKKVLPTTEITKDCMCGQGKFWHWRINKCVAQGPWGYECGFFPVEHHHRVCSDGLKCEKLEDVRQTYLPWGDSKKAQSHPATCVPCEAEDQCKVGEARQGDECLREYLIKGKEACVTVKVTNLETAVTIKEKSTFEHTAKSEATATVEAKYTAEATATFKATSKVIASALPKATSPVKATSLLAMKGPDDTKKATTKKYSTKATAQATSSADATATVVSKATKTHKATVKKSATVKYDFVPGIGYATGCVAVKEGYESLHIKSDMELGAVLAAKIISETERLAYEKATKAALAAANELGDLFSKHGMAVARASARADAMEKAEALAREAAAWAAEAGANKKAIAAAWARAVAAAKAKAKSAAIDEAEKAADEAAAQKAWQAAWDKTKATASTSANAAAAQQKAQWAAVRSAAARAKEVAVQAVRDLAAAKANSEAIDAALDDLSAAQARSKEAERVQKDVERYAKHAQQWSVALKKLEDCIDDAQADAARASTMVAHMEKKKVTFKIMQGVLDKSCALKKASTTKSSKCLHQALPTIRDVIATAKEATIKADGIRSADAKIMYSNVGKQVEIFQHTFDAERMASGGLKDQAELACAAADRHRAQTPSEQKIENGLAAQQAAAQKKLRDDAKLAKAEQEAAESKAAKDAEAAKKAAAAAAKAALNAKKAADDAGASQKAKDAAQSAKVVADKAAVTAKAAKDTALNKAQAAADAADEALAKAAKEASAEEADKAGKKAADDAEAEVPEDEVKKDAEINKKLSDGQEKPTVPEAKKPTDSINWDTEINKKLSDGQKTEEAIKKKLSPEPKKPESFEPSDAGAKAAAAAAEAKENAAAVAALAKDNEVQAASDALENAVNEATMRTLSGNKKPKGPAPTNAPRKIPKKDLEALLP